ncbi:HEAT repeat domain-containing protein [Catalinimonas niigatensis]|uniref:HEAT repeat domain-containing protein n=1 Tax=Catalinimonas niigatensis TaxID=1397264 RepID=UPI00266530DE|nr:HEAT repeat domain-containing protein [Catalinimonas niigatensis]WPP48244.1 HEAT repeat domain-containing protein [Catalinimonas niigatensis]
MKNILYQAYYIGVAHWESLKDFTAEVRYFMLTAMLLILLSTILIMVLYLRRLYLLSREKKEKELKFRFQYFIYDALVESSKQEVLSSTDLIVNKFKRHELNSSLEKQLMIDLMIELKKSFSGNSKKQFQHLYLCLGLHHESIAKLSSRNISEKIKGVRELSEIGYNCAELEIAFKEWQTSPYTLLADEVKIAAIRSGSVHMLSFLTQQKEPLSDWLQIQIRYHLKALPDEKVPAFLHWLNVQEYSSIKLVLEMIAIYKQEDAIEYITPILHHADDAIKIEAVKALESLEARKQTGAIFNLLDTDNEVLKIKAIHAIGELGYAFHANLLRPLLFQHSPEVRKAAEQAIVIIQSKSSFHKVLAKPHRSSL